MLLNNSSNGCKVQACQERASAPDYCVFNENYSILVVILVAIWIPNCLVVLLFLKNKQLRTHSINRLLFSLSILDLCTSIGLCIIVLFYFVCGKVNMRHYALVGDTLINFCTFVAVGHLLLLAGERTLSHMYALRYEEIVRKNRVHISLGIVWVVPLVISTVQLSWFYSPQRDYIDRIFSVISMVLFAILPTLLISGQYTYMYLSIRRLLSSDPNTTEAMKKRKELHALLMYCVMFLCFLVLVLPYFIVRAIIEYIPSDAISEKSFYILMVMRFVISILNPIVYTLLKNDFKEALKLCFKCTIRRGRETTHEQNELEQLQSQTDEPL